MTLTISQSSRDNSFFTTHETLYSTGNHVPGHTIIYRPVTISTNDDVISLGQKGFDEGIVVAADEQLMGRGRCGRTWHSPAGVNLYMSVLLRPPFSLKQGYTLTMMAAVSVVSAIEKVTGAGAFIKWPNDIMLGNKKIGGILTEVKSMNNMIKFSSLGIGLNVNTDLASMPDDVKEKASSLKIETGCHIERKELLLEILSEIEHWYHVLKSDGKESVFYTWRNMCKTPGTMVSVLTGNTVVRGHALGVGSSGELLVQSETGEIQKIMAGDVSPCRR